MLKTYLKKALGKIGYSITKNTVQIGKEESVETRVSHSFLFSKNNLLHNFYSILHQVNFIPSHIVDVGANHGSWTREALRFFPDANYTLLEPQKQMVDSIKDILETNPKVSFHGVGAGSEAGSFKFTIVDRDDSCNFLSSPEEARQNGFQQIDVLMVTLNDFLPGLNKSVPDMIKIDAEGLDLEVLTGSSDYFGETEIFMVEAAVVNKGLHNTVLNVLSFMDKNGYRIFDITDLNRTMKHNALWLVEIVFIKKNGILDKAIDSYT